MGCSGCGGLGFKLLRCRAEGVRRSPFAPGDAGTLTAFWKRSRVEMGSFWDLITPNTILRASLDVCFGHARSRCAAMAINEMSEEVNKIRVSHVASKVNYLWANIINSGIRY
jgi:hypothetical protein